MDLEAELNAWMDGHQDELFRLIAEEGERFRQAHPGMDFEEERLNALVMASRRYLVRALGQVLPRYLTQVPGALRGSAVSGEEPTTREEGR
jgi:hypothetical protein